MANVMQSLFGLTMPQQPVASDPLQAYSGLISGTGSSLQQNIAGAFGQQTPQQALSSIIQRSQQEADLSTPEGLTQLANNLNQFPQFSGIALAMRQEAAKLSQEQTKLSYEMAAKGAQIQKDIAAAGREKEPGKVGVTAATGEVVYQQGGQQFVIRGGQRVPFQGSIRQEGGVNVKLDVKGQENVLKIDEDDAKAYRAAKESSAKAIPILDKMQKLANEGIIQGSIPEARAGFLKALDTFGFSTAEARKVLGNTEQFNIQVRNLLQSIIKQFGYNPSNADVRFALESLPNASNSPEGLRQILNSLIKANKEQLNESTRALDYFRQNKGSFAGFQPKLDIVSPGTGIKTPSQMTIEELRAEINRKKASGE